ncbi:4-hydroxythreonine-4-phosphate dehydrogenase PdxA [Swingsia samuiensis]|uniref:4-hydroxythreonine-4-phosphate dehydrogenase n=1 Tax=Swingsia samuiensis TaxID=1293412 RepID=A0A4Y6ULY3_9PROT|nr:4-hydroxythreonine-4-phosphate dehydrogenase PdxA [Swingsia samuiensis]QDH17790.1 4-hydroxythreonine-4-phosphate dehydrogenase PdxA [Swingsia samuiensis]
MSLPIALTLGDPAGIGPELTVSAWKALKKTGLVFFWLGDSRLFNDSVPFVEIQTPEEAKDVFPTALPIISVRCPVLVQAGKPTPQNASAVISSIEKAVHFVQAEQASGVVTNPIAKNILAEAGFPYPGHTEFLAALCNSAGNEIMMLASPSLKVVPISIHVSLRNAIESLTSERVIEVAKATNIALKKDFGISAPHLAIAGLNPHAGEAGLMGSEEQDIIIPAINRLKSEGIHVSGPMPPDTMFSAGIRSSYDAAICMYHDQALIPLKTLDMAEGVNVTLGLPIIRTSPDHGTAFNIAQPIGSDTGKADVSSLLSAIKLADQMAVYRRKKS